MEGIFILLIVIISIYILTLEIILLIKVIDRTDVEQNIFGNPTKYVLRRVLLKIFLSVIGLSLSYIIVSLNMKLFSLFNSILYDLQGHP